MSLVPGKVRIRYTLLSESRKFLLSPSLRDIGQLVRWFFHCGTLPDGRDCFCSYSCTASLRLSVLPTFQYWRRVLVTYLCEIQAWVNICLIPSCSSFEFHGFRGLFEYMFRTLRTASTKSSLKVPDCNESSSVWGRPVLTSTRFVHVSSKFQWTLKSKLEHKTFL